MVAFYKHDIRAWLNGVKDLNGNQYMVYHVLCQLMYEQESPLVFHEKGLAGMCNLSRTVFKRVLDELVAMDLLQWTRENKITNRRVEEELEEIFNSRPSVRRERAKNSENFEKSQKISENFEKFQSDARNPLKTNETHSLPLPLTSYSTSNTLDTQRKGLGLGGVEPPRPPIDDDEEPLFKI